jgi:hypothetical protein
LALCSRLYVNAVGCRKKSVLKIYFLFLDLDKSAARPHTRNRSRIFCHSTWYLTFLAYCDVHC